MDVKRILAVNQSLYSGRGGVLEMVDMGVKCGLNQHPFTTTLDEFIKHKSHISQGKATDVEAEELGCVSCAEFQTNVGLGGVL